MNRSTIAIIAVSTLLLGSGASGLLFVKPALEENDKLKTQKAALTGQKKSLDLQVAELEAKLRALATDSVSFFDLRTAPEQRRTMEAKTVQTLASLTEIFNDHHIKVTVLEPKGETSGMNKPVPSPVPVTDGSAAPSPSPTPAADPNAVPTEPPVSLTHKAFHFQVNGEYEPMVKALLEIQGLPKAISVNQYKVRLLDDGTKTAGAPKEGELPVSPTLLQLDFQVSITYLMAGGAPALLPSPAPAMQQGAIAPAGGLFAWLFGEAAYATEAISRPVGVAPPAVTSATKHRLEGVSAEPERLRVHTGSGVPRYTLSGSRTQLVLDLQSTRLEAGATSYPLAAPGIKAVRALPHPSHSGVTRLVIDTDGTVRLTPHLDSTKRLAIAIADFDAPAPAPARASKPAFERRAAVAAPAARPVLIEGVSYADNAVIISTSEPKVSYRVVGGTKTRLIVELQNVKMPAPGKLFPIHQGGVKQVRAAQYTARPLASRLVFDTDGNVKLTPSLDGQGRLAIHVTSLPGAKPASKPSAALPLGAMKLPKAAPSAAPTPMAVPGAPAPMAVPKAPAITANTLPTAAPTPAGPQLKRSLATTYSFPIAREKVLGRRNPFKILPNTRSLANAPAAPGAGMIPLPSVPAAPGAPPALPTLPGAPAGAPAGQAKAGAPFVLKAVLLGAGGPPLAMIQAAGGIHTVGLNGTLPGNATVKSIQADHVLLRADGQSLRLDLRE